MKINYNFFFVVLSFTFVKSQILQHYNPELTSTTLYYNRLLQKSNGSNLTTNSSNYQIILS